MCGGYARVCVRCGLCGKVDPRPLNAAGTCPMCGRAAKPGAQHCSVCGARIPRAPGEVAHPNSAETVKREAGERPVRPEGSGYDRNGRR